jgi:hypothetical protein
MSAGECLLLCEGEDIEEKLVYAEDLIAFLSSQVGSANVDAMLAAPEPAPGSVPLVPRGRRERRFSAPSCLLGSKSAAGGDVQNFFIGDAVSSVPKKSSTPRKDSDLPLRPRAKTFYIGDHVAKTFFIGDREPTETWWLQSPEAPCAGVCTTPRSLRNLLDDDLSTPTTCSGSSSPSDTASNADTEFDTLLKRFLALGGLGGVQKTGKEDFKRWVCALSCTARDADDNAYAIPPKRPPA